MGKKTRDIAALAGLAGLAYANRDKLFGSKSKDDAGDETERLKGRGKPEESRRKIEDYQKKAPLDDTDKYPSGVMGGARQSDSKKPAAKSDSKLETITTRKDPREAEAGMSRGTRTTSTAGAGRGWR